MKTNAYSIYDRKALVYNSPFFMATDGQAVRALQDLVDDHNTAIARHPTDYVLFRIGNYDDQLGSMLPESPLSHVMDASSLIRIPAPPGLVAEHFTNGAVK